MNKMFFKLLAATLIIMFGVSVAPVNAFASTIDSDLISANNSPIEFHKDATKDTISPFANDSGGGGGSGSFTYFSNGAVVYSHGECMNMVLYLPSSFITKMNSAGNSVAGILGLLGASISNPIAAAAVVVVGANWAKVNWLDNGSGVSMIINWPALTPPMQSGCNYYMGH